MGSTVSNFSSKNYTLWSDNQNWGGTGPLAPPASYVYAHTCLVTSQLDWLHALYNKHIVCHLYQVAILECTSAFVVLHFNVIVCWSSSYSQLAKEALKYQRCPRRMLIMLMVCFSYTVTLYMASVYLHTRLPIIGSSWWKALILLSHTGWWQCSNWSR